MAAWMQQQAEHDTDTSARVDLDYAQFVADRAGALYWPDQQTLIVADLHLEKGSSFARFRTHLPPYDTAATLRQLASLIEIYAPRTVIALGDSVHDRTAWERLSKTDREQLVGLIATTTDWIWITGNHDPEPPSGVGGQSLDAITVGPVVMRHHPGGILAADQMELAGHLHPAARVIGRGGSARRPAFATDGRRMILPAFGAYAGGLCLSAKPFRPLFEAETFTAYVCGRSRVFVVPGKRVLGWT
ncbi:MAG: ligase-associated DNA damage response endonuclease PdeM [Pseudomonadota bacterium]